ncbi:MAG: S16 family serine protease, partial [Gammaproteobacteria bacterium]
VFEPDALRQIVRGYTREAGVRNLEREIAAVARKVARRLAEGHPEPVRITTDNLVEYLGRPRFFDEVAERTTRPGIATANTLDTIPGPLRDRMEVLVLSGYTDEEKIGIARQYLIPKVLAAHGLATDELSFEREAIRQIVRGYTREAGVRNLDREIAAVARKVARRLAEGQRESVRITAETLVGYLGQPRFFDEVAERTTRPGIATGLAWTPTGGDVLFVEVTMMPSTEERLVLTGMLGDVMRESAQAAVSYVWSHAESLDIDPKLFEGKTIHVHVPAGAIPKDGPSAGVTIMTALASLATRRPVRSEVAMTGEITLRGKVLPVGGIKDKVLAAHRTGIRSVILPSRNERDLEEVPEELRRELCFFFVDDAEEVLRHALTPSPADVRRPAG